MAQLLVGFLGRHGVFFLGRNASRVVLCVVQVKHVTHSKDRSFVQCDDGTMVEAAVVLDATGHSRRLVQYDKPFNPGYQIAYGIVAEVR